jgi:hypothetical protein
MLRQGSVCERGSGRNGNLTTFYGNGNGKLTRSAIRLDEHRAFGGDRSDVLSTLASVPAAAVAAVQSGWAWVTRKVPFLDGLFMRSGRYSHLPLDEDGESMCGGDAPAGQEWTRTS